MSMISQYIGREMHGLLIRVRIFLKRMRPFWPQGGRLYLRTVDRLDTWEHPLRAVLSWRREVLMSS